MSPTTKIDSQNASLRDRYEAMAESVQALRASLPDARVTDRSAVAAELEAWAVARREVNSKIL